MPFPLKYAILRGDHNQCPSCGAYFNSTHAFDTHRTGKYGSPDKVAERRCLTEAEMLAKGMAISESGWWLSSRWTGPVG